MSASREKAFRLILLLGLVSLTADMVYEGARSITGPYLLILGASATIVGLVTGVGEVVAYGSRVLFGHIADRSGRHWTLIITGYMMILSLPLLAFANRLDLASALIILERLGKAIRTPARDAIVADAASSIGKGKGFGIHEALDQIGAVAGPLLVTLLLYHGGYSSAFLYLFIPVIATGSLLVYTRRFATPSLYVDASPKVSSSSSTSMPWIFWLYLAFVSISIAGYAHFQIISYHIKLTSVIDDLYIPMLFALAMGIDALMALMVGYLFDRYGLIVLILIPLTSMPIAPLAFSLSSSHIIIGIILWGAVMGMQETIMRASIAVMIDRTRLATAYGIFNGIYGIAWLSGSMVIGILYDLSVVSTIIFSVILSAISLIPLLVLLKGTGSRASSTYE
ncbi:MAG: MFS transporter [Candidatus Nitrosocaldus sp.]